MTDTKRQLDAAETAVLVVEDANLATLVVTGHDRVTWLNGLLTCDLATRTTGDAVYGLAVGKNGRILADMVVVLADSRVVLAVPAKAIAELRASLDHYLVMEDAEMGEEQGGFTVYVAHGPRAGDVVAAAREAGALAGAVDLAGVGGAIVLSPSADDAPVRAALARAVAKAGGVMGDARGAEALRLARGVPRFGVDFDAKTYPQEAGLETRAVSFSKGCYLGQEVVCMLEMRGHVKRKLVPLVVESSEVPARGAKVVDDAGAEVGEVTSAGESMTEGRAVALAMVKRASAEVGTSLKVAGASAKVAAASEWGARTTK